MPASAGKVTVEFDVDVRWAQDQLQGIDLELKAVTSTTARAAERRWREVQTHWALSSARWGREYAKHLHRASPRRWLALWKARRSERQAERLAA